MFAVTLIEPWQLYLILQLDRISDTVDNIMTFGIIFTAIAVIIATAAHVISASEDVFDKHSSQLRKSRRMCAGMILLTVMLAVLNGLIPSTKTAAIAFGVPAVVNNTVVQQEASEAWQLLKQAMSDKPASDTTTTTK